MDEAIEAGRRLLAGAERVVVLTGAGISTDSGIQDFRGPNGLWTKDPEAEKLATLDHYVSDPAIRAKAWRRRVETLSTAYEPNAGHHALVRLEQRGVLDTLITQNVDGLHLRAGTSRERLVEIHGTTQRRHVPRLRRPCADREGARPGAGRRGRTRPVAPAAAS